MKIDSAEYKALMKKWSDEAWEEETGRAREEYIENEDYHGRLEAQ